MKIGLFFGSFNPIHIGHLIIANHMVTCTDMDELWFVVSPHNPLKEKKSLLADHHRLEMVHMAIEDNDYFKTCDIEFKLPKPSYTIHTIANLKEKYPQHQFGLIMGMDNLQNFHKWKNYELLLKAVDIYVYPRPGSTTNENIPSDKIHITNAPIMEISSSSIRQKIQKGKSIKYMVSSSVEAYIDKMNFYR